MFSSEERLLTSTHETLYCTSVMIEAPYIPPISASPTKETLQHSMVTLFNDAASHDVHVQDLNNSDETSLCTESAESKQTEL